MGEKNLGGLNYVYIIIRRTKRIRHSHVPIQICIGRDGTSPVWTVKSHEHAAVQEK